MKRITPTRELRLALVIGVAGVCAGVAAGQQRHGGGAPHQSAPSYHAPAYQYRAPAQAYHQAQPGYRQQAPAQQQYMPGRYGQQQSPAPVERRAPQAQGQMAQIGPMQRPQGQPAPRGEHLAEWMNQHRNLTPEQQQQALSREPGFNQLPQATQDRMRNQLARLNAMPPEQRQRILNYNEHMERLPLAQRAEVRGALQQLGALPQDQRRQVAQAWRNLRDLPGNQQAAALNSPQYQSMNPTQRATLNNLLHVSPLLPPTEQQPR